MEKMVNRQISNIYFKGPDLVCDLKNNSAFDCILRIMVRPYHIREELNSYTLYVDNTNLRHNKFRNPILRISRANRKRLNRETPEVKYYKLRLTNLDKIDIVIKAIDKELNKIDFLVGGLILDRSEPEGCLDNMSEIGDNNGIEIYRWNFCQRIDYRYGISNEKRDPITQRVMEIIDLFEGKEIIKTKMQVVEYYSPMDSLYIKEKSE